MLRVERNKANIFCVNGIQFKPGITEVSEPEATELMNTRQFKGSIANGDMRILEYDMVPVIAEKTTANSQRKQRVTQATIIKIVNDCLSVEELKVMFKKQRNKKVQTAIKDRIISLTDADTDKNKKSDDNTE